MASLAVVAGGAAGRTEDRVRGQGGTGGYAQLHVPGTEAEHKFSFSTGYSTALCRCPTENTPSDSNTKGKRTHPSVFE